MTHYVLLHLLSDNCICACQSLSRHVLVLELDQDREVIQPLIEKATLEDEIVVASKVVPNSPLMKKTRVTLDCE